MSRDSDPKLLTIDDDRWVRQSIAAFFDDCYFQVAEAENGEEGLKVFKEFKPDVVLVDLHMPIMGGQEVIKRLKSIAPDIPTIVVSGNGMINETVNAMNCGAWAYVMKPINDLGELERKVRRSLEKASMLNKYKSSDQEREIEEMHVMAAMETEIKELKNTISDLENQLQECKATHQSTSES